MKAGSAGFGVSGLTFGGVVRGGWVDREVGVMVEMGRTWARWVGM
jgi:hypothetical protein